MSEADDSGEGPAEMRGLLSLSGKLDGSAFLFLDLVEGQIDASSELRLSATSIPI